MKELLTKWGPQFEQAEVSPLGDAVWRVQLGRENYVLKHRATRTRVWEEYNLLNWLTKNGQPISPLLHTEGDVPWAEYQGGIYVLYRFVDGTPGSELDLYDEDLATEVGSALARLHRELASYEGSEAFPSFDLFQEVAGFAWPEVQAYAAVKFRQRLHDLRQTLEEQLNTYEVLPRQLIHRDFHPGNIVFGQGKLVGILDFDRVRIGVRLFDLCYLATAVLSSGFSDPKRRAEWPGFVQALVKGYQSVQPLTRTESCAFLHIIYLIQLLFIGHFLDNGSNGLADLNLAMLLWINDQHDFLQTLVEKSAAGGWE